MASGKDETSLKTSPHCLDGSQSIEEEDSVNTTSPVIPEVLRQTVESTETPGVGNTYLEDEDNWSRQSLSLLLNFTSKSVLHALKMGRDFSVGHDVQSAGLFGDFVLRHRNSDGNGILHSVTSIVGLSVGSKSCDGCGEGHNKVTESDLSSDEGPYALQKYFASFVKMAKGEDFIGGIDRMTVVTIGDGGALISPELFQQVEGNEEAFSALQAKVLKDKEMWRKDLTEKTEPELKALVEEFLEKLQFAEYTPAVASDLTRELELIRPTQRPETFFLMFKDDLEQWLSCEEGKYLTSKDIQVLLEQNAGLLTAGTLSQAIGNVCSA